MLVWSGLYLLVMALTRLSAAQARVLCLHYYSNALGFNFEDQEEVYREEKIKEWEPVDPADIEVFLQLCLVRGGPLLCVGVGGVGGGLLLLYTVENHNQQRASQMGNGGLRTLGDPNF